MIVPDTRYVERRALCTFGRVFASSFDLRDRKSTGGGRIVIAGGKGTSVSAEVAGKRKKNNKRGEEEWWWSKSDGWNMAKIWSSELES